jgi:hypothetical protein
MVALIYLFLFWQLTLLSGSSSQVVLSTDGLVEDGSGKIILDAANAEKNSNKISIIPGLGVDIATIDLTNISGEGSNGDIVTDPTNNGAILKSGCLTLDLSTSIPLTSTSQQNNQVFQPSLSRRGPGRPRREDTEVDPPVGKVLTYCQGQSVIKFKRNVSGYDSQHLRYREYIVSRPVVDCCQCIILWRMSQVPYHRIFCIPFPLLLVICSFNYHAVKHNLRN